MNNRQLVEIAALVSAYSQYVIVGSERLPAGALEKFWDRSQRRLKLWLSALTRYQRRLPDADPLQRHQLWLDLQPDLEEIFVSEVLTRVWGAVLTAMDQEQGTHFNEAIARNVLIGHLDARKRALQILVADKSLTVEQLAPIDTIRRRVERWTDLLLGHLVERYNIDDFAFDVARARDFGADQLLQSTNLAHDQAWKMLLVGLQGSFSTNPIDPPNEVIQEEIIGSILGCFPPAAFPTEGPFRPIITSRNVARDSNAATSQNATRMTSAETFGSTATAPQEIPFRDLRRKFPPR